MRLTTITLTILVQLASLALAVPVSNEPESSLTERAVLEPRFRHSCDNYQHTYLGV